MNHDCEITSSFFVDEVSVACVCGWRDRAYSMEEAIALLADHRAAPELSDP